MCVRDRDRKSGVNDKAIDRKEKRGNGREWKNETVREIEKKERGNGRKKRIVKEREKIKQEIKT